MIVIDTCPVPLSAAGGERGDHRVRRGSLPDGQGDAAGHVHGGGGWASGATGNN